MKASKENPVYTVAILSDTTKYDVTPALINLDLQEANGQLAQVANLTLANIKVQGQWLSSLIGVRQRIFIYANDGATKAEVFRGVIWTDYYRSALEDREMQLKCYDNLIYFQESEEAEYFTTGKTTQDILSTICTKWGVKLNYTYQSITHSKLALRGKLADVITSDILDLVKNQTGKKYVIRSVEDVINIMQVGQNTTLYNITSKNNAVSTRSEKTMDGMITRVVILGKADKDKREPVEATVDGDVAQYGTLQKLLSRKENTSLADAQKEAKEIIAEKGTPKLLYEVQCADVPWIRKGDLVHVAAGNIEADLIAVGVTRSISNKAKTMTLTLERNEDAVIKENRSTDTSSSSGSGSGSSGGSGGSGSGESSGESTGGGTAADPVPANYWDNFFGV